MLGDIIAGIEAAFNLCAVIYKSYETVKIMPDLAKTLKDRVQIFKPRLEKLVRECQASGTSQKVIPLLHIQSLNTVLGDIQKYMKKLQDDSKLRKLKNRVFYQSLLDEYEELNTKLNRCRDDLKFDFEFDVDAERKAFENETKGLLQCLIDHQGQEHRILREMLSEVLRFIKGHKALNLNEQNSPAIVTASAFMDNSDSATLRAIIDEQSAIEYELPPSEVVLEDIELGAGTFGVVYKATYNNQDVAIKKPHRRESDVLAELMNQERCSGSPFVALIHGFVYVNEIRSIVMEFMPCGTLGGLLRHAMGRDGIVSISKDQQSLEATLAAYTVIQLFHKVSEGMRFISQRNVIHRDLKPENILLSQTLDPKIGDFGSARELANSATHLSGSAAGSVYYMAPEVLTVLKADKGQYSYPADQYSFGMIMVKCCHGLFGQQSRVDRHDEDAPLPEIPLPDAFPSSVTDIKNNCIASDPLMRYGRGTASESLLSEAFEKVLQQLDSSVSYPKIDGYYGDDVAEVANIARIAFESKTHRGVSGIITSSSSLIPTPGMEKKPLKDGEPSYSTASLSHSSTSAKEPVPRARKEKKKKKPTADLRVQKEQSASSRRKKRPDLRVQKEQSASSRRKKRPTRSGSSKEKGQPAQTGSSAIASSGHNDSAERERGVKDETQNTSEYHSRTSRERSVNSTATASLALSAAAYVAPDAFTVTSGDQAAQPEEPDRDDRVTVTSDSNKVMEMDPAQVVEAVPATSDGGGGGQNEKANDTTRISDEDENAEDELHRKYLRKRFIIPGVVLLAIAAIVSIVVAVKPWDTGGGGSPTFPPTVSPTVAPATETTERATGLVMSLIGIDTEFDENDSELWATATKAFVEDYYNTRRRRRGLGYLQTPRILQVSNIQNVETSLDVTNTIVVEDGNGGEPSLRVTYNQAITYTFEDSSNENISMDAMVTEPFKTSDSRSAYQKDLQAAGTSAGSNIFDNLIGTSEVSTSTAAPTPSPTNSIPITELPTQDPASPPSTPGPTTLNPTSLPTTNPTPRPTLNPTPRPTLNPTPRPTLNPTPRPTPSPAPTTPNPTSGGGSSSLPPNGPWDPVGQTLHGKAADDYFGKSVSLSRDGRVMAVGAEQSSSNPGYVVVQRYNPSTQQWTQIGQDLIGQADGDGFGESVSINGDGTILAVGADENDSGGLNAGHVRVFEYNSASDRWVQLGSDILGQDAGDWFGDSVSLSDAGDILAVGAWRDDTENGDESGSVRLYQYDRGSSSWNQLGQTLIGQAAGDYFGRSVSLNAQGTIVGVGAHYNDSGGNRAGQVSVFEHNSSSSKWDPLGNPINGEVAHGRFGFSVSLDDSGLIVAAGAPFGNNERVLVYSYDRSTLTWNQRGQTLLTQQPDDVFGYSVSLSGNGNVLAVGSVWHDVNGSSNVGQVRIFQHDSNADEWKQVGNPLNGKAEYDWFGNSVSLSADGSVVGVGARLADVNGDDSGSAYAFTVNDN